jgi:hypothetical protein
LSRHQGEVSSLANLRGELQATYGFEDRFTVRLGLNYFLSQSVLTLTTAFGVSQMFEDYGLRLGGQVLWQWQPSTNSQKLAFGLEASLPLEPGVFFTVGFNLVGYADALGLQTSPGIYLRLDYSFERLLAQLFAR